MQTYGEYLSVPSKTILLEEGEIARKLYLVVKVVCGCFSIMQAKIIQKSEILSKSRKYD